MRGKQGEERGVRVARSGAAAATALRMRREVVWCCAIAAAGAGGRGAWRDGGHACMVSSGAREEQRRGAWCACALWPGDGGLELERLLTAAEK